MEPTVDRALSPHLWDGTGSDRTADERDALWRRVFVFRARCSNLRHWCRSLLGEPGATEVLDEATRADLRTTVPGIGEAEAHVLIGQLTRGENAPANHPLAPPTSDTNSLRAVLTSVAAEHERLRQAFFALYDHLHPGDNLTDEYFLAQQGAGPMHAMADVLTELERGSGERP